MILVKNEIKDAVLMSFRNKIVYKLEKETKT